MKYRIHRVEIKVKDVQTALEIFLIELEGEAISILPTIKKGILGQTYGVTENVDYLVIVEKFVDEFCIIFG